MNKFRNRHFRNGGFWNVTSILKLPFLYLVENYISIVAAQIHLSHYLLNNYQIRLNIFPNVQST